MRRRRVSWDLRERIRGSEVEELGRVADSGLQCEWVAGTGWGVDLTALVFKHSGAGVKHTSEQGV